MLGAIAGDIIGSVYENVPAARADFPLFGPRSTPTDDSVLSVAVAEAALTDGDYRNALRRWARRYPDAGYGAGFTRWVRADDPADGDSFGNGAAMRVSAIGWLFDDEDAVLDAARASARPSHGHPDALDAAQAVALAVFLARRAIARDDLRLRLGLSFGYDLDRDYETVRAAHRPDTSARGSVPEALIAFLTSCDFEDAVRRAVRLGGDADTQACIAGAVAEAYYGGVPAPIATAARERLSDDMATVLDRFSAHRRLPP